MAFTLRRGRLLWGLAVLLAIPAAARTAHLYLGLRSDVEALLPQEAASVVALEEMRRRMPGLQHLGIVVDAGGDGARLAAGERLLDDLAARIRHYPPDLVRAVRTGVGPTRAFIESRLPLYMDLADLRRVRASVEDRIHWAYGRETGTLLDEDEPPPSLDFADLEAKYRARAGGAALPGDRFADAKKGLALLLVEVAGYTASDDTAARLLARVEADLAALGGPERYAAGLRLGFTGDVAIQVEETSALRADLTLASLLVIGAVMLVLLLYYRWWGAVPALGAPLAVAAVLAFAAASLPPFGVTELNSNTAFLGSIIVGNGINFGIILLARYVEARRAGAGVEEALCLAVDGTRTGTLAAALAAFAAYGSLVAMQFRGFRQFGIIGGLGMLLAWLATFLLAPSLVARLDRGRLHTGTRPVRASRPMAALATAVTRRPHVFAALGGLLTLLALVELRDLGPARLEHDFSRLRRADTWLTGEGYWGRRMDDLLGRYLTPTVILTRDLDQARRIGAALHQQAEQPPLADLVASVRTLDDVIPPDQAAKIAEVEVIRRKLTAKIRDGLASEQRDRIDRLLGRGPLSPFGADDAPEAMVSGLRDRDGKLGRAVLVYPRLSHGTWRGPTLSAFVAQLRAVTERVAGPDAGARVAGALPISADILTSMRRDGPLASALAFAGVVTAVLVLFRAGGPTPYVVGSLMVGVLWLLGATLFFDVKINFVNLIAFPITFGIGVDYAVNVMGRYVNDGAHDVLDAVRATGGAVGMCSLTTIIGYSSLLVAQNRGLFLFGVLAVLGEIACLVTAVAVLPAVLVLLRGRGLARASASQPSGDAAAE